MRHFKVTSLPASLTLDFTEIENLQSAVKWL